MARSRWTLVAAACAALLAAPAEGEAQAGESRYGVWRMRSDAAPPFSNVMTYGPHGDGGMSVTVAAVNSRGERTEWGYDTRFDGVFRPVHGQQSAETAVEVIDERRTRILNRRNGRVTQVIVNTLAEDGDTIHNEYVRLDEQGRITGVSHAVYERVR